MHLLFYNLIELSIFLIVAIIAIKAPESVFRFFRGCIRRCNRIACNPNLAVWVAGGLGFSGSIIVSLIFGIPEPRFQDEFCNILAGQTFASGRVTNPSHPMWIHFETFHVIHQPTYASKFPPAQGLALAFGQMIGGHPIVGVWVSVGLACAALCWMLQTWVPKRWALFGVGLSLLQVRYYYDFQYSPGSMWGYWSQSYWGGAIAVLGGALVFGALPRLLRKPKVFESLALGLGLSILAISRPFEGFVTAVATIVALPLLLVRRAKPQRPESLRVVLLPICIVLALTCGGIAYYNMRITGSAFRFPYLLHAETYMASPLFFFQSELPEKVYHHELIRDFHRGWEFEPYLRHQSTRGLLTSIGSRVLFFGEFYWGPTLAILFLVMLPFLFGNPRNRFGLVVVGLALSAQLTTNWLFPHHMAPLLPMVTFLIVQSMRQFRLWSFWGTSRGFRLFCAVLITLVASTTCFFALKFFYRSDDWSQIRKRIIAELDRQPEQHLVLVRYIRSDHQYLRSHFEWVNNGPDIDHAKVVWAREMDRQRDQELLDYYKGRRAWLLVHDDTTPPSLVPYPEGRTP